MTGFAVATEDALSEAVAETLLTQVGGHSVAMRLRKDGFGYLKSRVRNFDEIARNGTPLLLLTDLDQASCAPALIARWLPGGTHSPLLLLRVAVRETESWLLADRAAFAELLDVSQALVPARPDELPDPKAALLGLVRHSKRRELRAEILPRAGVSFPVGLGYNDCLCRFVRESWDSRRAAASSPSLARTLARLAQFRTHAH